MRALIAFGVCMCALSACRTTPPVQEDAVPVEPTSCRCEDGCAADCAVDEDATTSYRKVVRDPTSAEPRKSDPADAFTVLDVQAGEALDEAALETVAQELNLEASSLVGGFRGDFVRGRGVEYAVLTKGGELEVFKDGQRFAELQLGEPLGADALQAVKLVDERLDVVVRHRENDREVLTVCRVIGRAIGRIFDTPTEGHVVEFVQLAGERAIRVQASSSSAAVFRWNPWEGMFRIPAAVPTAPPR